MFTNVRILKNEVGLCFRHGDFRKVLGPGAHFIPRHAFGIDRIQVFDTLESRFVHPQLDILVREPDLRAELEVVDIVDGQRALVWKDGRLGWIVGPGVRGFWKRPYRIEVEVLSTDEPLFEHARIDAILGHADAASFLRAVQGVPGERVLLFRDSEVIASSDGGRLVFWKGAPGVTWKSVDMREQVIDVAGQEIMTADRVTLRMNLVVACRVVDAETAVTVVDDYKQALYREAQLALREIVGARALDSLLSDKQAVGTEVRESIAERAAEFGIVVKSVGLRDIILPGDMKTILNQVIEAQKRAEANLIRRRMPRGGALLIHFASRVPDSSGASSGRTP